MKRIVIIVILFIVFFLGIILGQNNFLRNTATNIIKKLYNKYVDPTANSIIPQIDLVKDEDHTLSNVNTFKPGLLKESEQLYSDRCYPITPPTPGIVIGTKECINEKECQQFCGDDTRCHGYSYNNNKGVCELFKPKQLSGVNTAYKRPDKKYDIHEDRLLEGDVIDRYTVPFMEDCGDICNENSNCRWYDFELANRQCRLKSVPKSNDHTVKFKYY